MNDEIYYNILERLIELREKHHITVTDMADYVNVTRQSIYNFESKRRKSLYIMLSYLTHPAFDHEEVKEIYTIMGA